MYHSPSASVICNKPHTQAEDKWSELHIGKCHCIFTQHEDVRSRPFQNTHITVGVNKKAAEILVLTTPCQTGHQERSQIFMSECNIKMHHLRKLKIIS